MPLTEIFRRARRLFPAAAFCILAAGCSYKSEIRQGDDTLPDKIAELHIGMSRAEVVDLLGESRFPVVFEGEEMIYYYRRRAPGFFPTTKTWGVALTFDGDSLAAIRPLGDGANE